MEQLNKYEVTYKELLRARDNSQLIPGNVYRITDFITTTTQANTKSAGHQFDLLVLASAPNILSEEARVCKHEGISYFDKSKLNAWKVWYCIDNDKERFAWADTIKGKGVIYRMIDEFNNDCPYDFSNIIFRRSYEWFEEHSNWSKYVLGRVPTNDMYFYTFSYVAEDGVVEDLVMVGNNMKNDEGNLTGVHDNIIKPCDSPTPQNIYKLNSNIFVSTYYWSECFNGIYGNEFKANCCNNTFGNECNYNILEGSCENNVFGNHCSSNKLMARCKNNKLKSSSFSNTLGFGCEEIHLMDSSYNVFGNECYDIHTYSSTHSNTFGSYCRHINCGNQDMSNTTSIRFNKFQSNIRYVNLISSKSGNIQNLNISQGLKGTPINYLKIKIDIVNQNYPLNIGTDSNGELVIYNKFDKK